MWLIRYLFTPRSWLCPIDALPLSPSSPEIYSVWDVQGRRWCDIWEFLPSLWDGYIMEAVWKRFLTISLPLFMQILTKCFLRSYKTFLVNEENWEAMRSRLSHSSKDTISTCTSTPQRSQKIPFFSYWDTSWFVDYDIEGFRCLQTWFQHA
jgi:hypothetical protein